MESEDKEEPWIWDGTSPANGMSLFVAKPKIGKTTMALNLSVAVAGGVPFLDRATTQGPVVYLALEENKHQVKTKLKALGVSEDLPLKHHFGVAPIDAIKEVEPLIVDTGAKLLVIDLLQKFCRVRDLNDYAQVTTALEPILAASRKQNCHVILTHHAGKADRPDGDDILGSTGLLGGVDTTILIKKRENRRTFSTIQRYHKGDGEDLPETVIELNKDGSLSAKGTRQDVEIEETMLLVVEALKAGGTPAITDLYDQIEKSKSLVSKPLMTPKKRVHFSLGFWQER